MKHIETSFRTFLNYKLNEQSKSSTLQDEPEDQEPIVIEDPEDDQNQDEEEGIDKLITEYQKLKKEWKENQKKRFDDILQG
jgi:hypothetical protein